MSEPHQIHEKMPTRPGRYLQFGFKCPPLTEEQLRVRLKAYSGWTLREMPEAHVAAGFLWGINVPIKKGSGKKQHAERVVRLLQLVFGGKPVLYGYNDVEVGGA